MFIQSTDSTQQLHYSIWEPQGKPKAILQLVHGMEEYIGRYTPLASALADMGWAVIGHDHLGHGQSGRWERGFFTDNDDGASILIEDIHLISKVAKERWGTLPLFIFGHSMGSFFLRRYLAEYSNEIDGAIICGSGWYNAFLTGTGYYAALLIGALRGKHTKDAFLTFLCSSPFANAFKEDGKLAWLSKNKENVRQYIADPLCGFGFTCEAYEHMYKNLFLVSKECNFSNMRPIPLLVISGADDPVGGAKSVKKIANQYRKYGFTDVTERSIVGNRHEILFEDDAPETIKYIANWLGKRLN